MNMRKALYSQYTVGLLFYYGVTIIGYWAYGSSVSVYLPEQIGGAKWIKVFVNAAVFLQSLVSQHVRLTMSFIYNLCSFGSTYIYVNTNNEYIYIGVYFASLRDPWHKAPSAGREHVFSRKHQTKIFRTRGYFHSKYICSCSFSFPWGFYQRDRIIFAHSSNLSLSEHGLH